MKLTYLVKFSINSIYVSRFDPDARVYATFRWKDEYYRSKFIDEQNDGVLLSNCYLKFSSKDDVNSYILVHIFCDTETEKTFCGHCVIRVTTLVEKLHGEKTLQYFYINPDQLSLATDNVGAGWIFACYDCVITIPPKKLDLRRVEGRNCSKKMKNKSRGLKALTHRQKYLKLDDFMSLCKLVKSISQPLVANSELQGMEVKRLYKALIIGITYEKTKFRLFGSAKDAMNIRNLLVNTYGWPDNEKSIRVLQDSGQGIHYPTKKNILKGLRWLVRKAEPGDVLFLYYSGHGTAAADAHALEGDALDEGWLPVDHINVGLISDNVIQKKLVRKVPNGVRLTAVVDCCNSGSVLDLPYTYEETKWTPSINPYLVMGDIQLLSSCLDSEYSFEKEGGEGENAGGKFTNIVVEILTKQPKISFVELLQITQRKLFIQQKPQLSVSQVFDYQRPFEFSRILTNRNKLLGQVLWNAAFFTQMLNPQVELFPENTDAENNEMLHFFYHAYMPDVLNDSSD